ncbi:MAG: methyltransferase domain-containing protein [Proteobacteria bacterium]|nr:methyltransferase domain-containing protein [Pseudomonadota bacterium]MBI3496488.1 methyltransferase domain-containing protein [Pseudomonadota bacterium]
MQPLQAIERAAYALSQGLRVSWYLGHYLATVRIQPRPTGRRPRPRGGARPPGLGEVLADLGQLFLADRASIEAGQYRLPGGFIGPWTILDALDRSLLYFRDLPAVFLRRRTRNGEDVRQDPTASRYPAYYRQNFHYQSDGYLSAKSARLYDHQVETLFIGGADAMRRRLLVPLAELLRRRGRRPSRLLDLGCGTGRLLHQIKANHPRLATFGLDLSPPYLTEARRSLDGCSKLVFINAKAEALPLASASMQAVTASFLFHELPAQVRREVVKEVARVLEPGGAFLFLDSLQTGDHPPYDAILERFPAVAHEPYYADYIGADLPRLFGDHGLVVERSERAFFAKLLVARRR